MDPVLDAELIAAINEDRANQNQRFLTGGLGGNFAPVANASTVGTGALDAILATTNAITGSNFNSNNIKNTNRQIQGLNQQAQALSGADNDALRAELKLQADAEKAEAKAQSDALKLQIQQNKEMRAQENAELERELKLARIGKVKADTARSLRPPVARTSRSRGTTVVGADGKPKKVKPLKSPQIKQINEFDTVVNQAQGLLDKIDANKDVLGPINARAKGSALNVFDNDTKVRAQSIAAEIGSIRQAIGKILEGGKLAAGDEPKFRALLGTETDDPETLKNKLRQAIALTKQSRNTFVGSFGSAGFDVSGFQQQAPAAAPAAAQPAGETPEQRRARLIELIRQRRAGQ